MSQPPRALPNLLAHWDSVVPRLRDSPRVALFLDFDGTLVPFASRPDQVRLAPSTRRLLSRLAGRPRLRVTVISGRRRRDLLRYIAVRNVHYWGLYGWEAGAGSVISGSDRSALRDARAALGENLIAFPGIWVEDKDSSLSIHLAAARPAVKAAARRRIPALLRPFRGRLHILRNLRELEVAPLRISDKGAALRRSLTGEFRRALPVYFGDDYSDEPAFAAARQGLPVIVGDRRPTQARFRVRDPEEVADALWRLDKALA